MINKPNKLNKLATDILDSLGCIYYPESKDEINYLAQLIGREFDSFDEAIEANPFDDSDVIIYHIGEVEHILEIDHYDVPAQITSELIEAKTVFYWNIVL